MCITLHPSLQTQKPNYQNTMYILNQVLLIRMINNQQHFHLQPTIPKIRIYRYKFEQTNKNKTQQKATLTKSISSTYTRDGKGTDSYRLCSLLHWLDILNRVQVWHEGRKVHAVARLQVDGEKRLWIKQVLSAVLLGWHRLSSVAWDWWSCRRKSWCT